MIEANGLPTPSPEDPDDYWNYCYQCPYCGAMIPDDGIHLAYGESKEAVESLYPGFPVSVCSNPPKWVEAAGELTVSPSLAHLAPDIRNLQKETFKRDDWYDPH